VLPSDEYKDRRRTREARVADFERTHIRLGNVRLLLAVVTAILLWTSLRQHLLSPLWIICPVAMFATIAVWHSRVLRSQELAKRAVAFYDRGLARIEDRWAGTGESGERFANPHHVYSADLDLFGDASLFQLISSARTRMGEVTLAGWLLTPGTRDEIGQRHQAVKELRPELDLREDLSVLGEDARVGVHPEQLTEWAESPNQIPALWLAWVSPILAVLAIVGAVIWAARDLATVFVAVIVVEAVLTYWLKKPIETVLHGTENAFHDLELLSGVMARIEAHTFRSPELRNLQGQLLSASVSASQAIAKLRSLVDLILSRNNVLVRIIDVPLMYSVQLALAVEHWRKAHGHAVKQWIAIVGEMEALISLAAYSYEHPDDPFPDVTTEGASFEAEDLGHPLLPNATCIRNNVLVGGDARVLLVSGSNMSGKSTLLRAIGINTVLAMAGAPVRARRLRLSPLRVGASIRINDSLQEGSSRFYAEITRLRQILDLTGATLPVLFLLDELLQGTNSKDRRVGGEGIVRALVERGSIGLVSTHDLALADIGGTLDGHLRNVHFQDELANGRITFDYKLRDGVVTKSNGLELMRSIGLDV
jgi:hypothetical protein